MITNINYDEFDDEKNLEFKKEYEEERYFKGKLKEEIESKSYIKAEINWEELELIELRKTKRNINSDINKKKKLISTYQNRLETISDQTSKEWLETEINTLENKITKNEKEIISLNYQIDSKKRIIFSYYQILNIFYSDKKVETKKIIKQPLNSKKWVKTEINKLNEIIAEKTHKLEIAYPDFWTDEDLAEEFREEIDKEFESIHDILYEIYLYEQILNTFHSKKRTTKKTKLQLDSTEWLETEINRLKTIKISKYSLDNEKIQHHIKFYESLIK